MSYNLAAAMAALSAPPIGKNRVGTIEVSTVRLPHGHGRNADLWFETMLFCDDPTDLRHQTFIRWRDEVSATAGHWAAVTALTRGEALEWWS